MIIREGCLRSNSTCSNPKVSCFMLWRLGDFDGGDCDSNGIILIRTFDDDKGEQREKGDVGSSILCRRWQTHVKWCASISEEGGKGVDENCGCIWSVPKLMVRGKCLMERRKPIHQV